MNVANPRAVRRTPQEAQVSARVDVCITARASQAVYKRVWGWGA
jgi:hypothetical protein